MLLTIRLQPPIFYTNNNIICYTLLYILCIFTFFLYNIFLKMHNTWFFLRCENVVVWDSIGRCGVSVENSTEIGLDFYCALHSFVPPFAAEPLVMDFHRKHYYGLRSPSIKAQWTWDNFFYKFKVNETHYRVCLAAFLLSRDNIYSILVRFYNFCHDQSLI